jgi:hypothetical protein
MGPTQVNGLPAHVLLVHAVVVLVPLSAALLAVAAWWPAARARLGVVLPLLAALGLVLVPLTTSAGEWLQPRVGPSPDVERHAELGDQLLPWAVGVLLLSVVVWLLGRRDQRALAPDDELRRPAEVGSARTALLMTTAVAVLSTAVAAGTVVQVVRIGDSGARAVWGGVTS